MSNDIDKGHAAKQGFVLVNDPEPEHIEITHSPKAILLYKAYEETKRSNLGRYAYIFVDPSTETGLRPMVAEEKLSLEEAREQLEIKWHSQWWYDKNNKPLLLMRMDLQHSFADQTILGAFDPVALDRWQPEEVSEPQGLTDAEKTTPQSTELIVFGSNNDLSNVSDDPATQEIIKGTDILFVINNGAIKRTDKRAYLFKVPAPKFT